MLPRPVDPLIGRELGEYVVGESLGEGGFGKVYRAQQAALSREAVIKVLHVGRRVDEGMLRRFTAEAQIASRLDHPYAAHVYGFGAEEDGLLWIAMELVRGAPLDVELTLHGPIKLERFVPFFERVCEVVHTAHEQNIVHRDLKPANIMVLARAGRLLPKLLDFGIAKVLSTVSPDIVLTRPIVPTGTSGPVGAWARAPLASSAIALAMPKSSSFGNSRPARDTTITFAGLMSRCTMPCSCAVWMTSQIRSSSGTNFSTASGPLAWRYSASVVPRTSSIASHNRPSDSAPNA